MTALAAAFEARRKDDGRIVAYPVGIIQIWKGALVSLRADGYLYPARSGTATDRFVGVAVESVNNTAGAAGALLCKVEKIGDYVYNKASAVQADLAVAGFYAADDNTLTATSTNNQLVGYPVELIDSSHLRIRINLAAL